MHRFPGGDSRPTAAARRFSHDRPVSAKSCHTIISLRLPISRNLLNDHATFPFLFYRIHYIISLRHKFSKSE